MATFFLCLLVFLGTMWAPILTMGVIMIHYGHTIFGTIMVVVWVILVFLKALANTK